MRDKETSLFKKYKVKEAPQITLVTAGQKPMPYKGKMSYIDIFEFINIYSETFVFGDQKEDEVSIASKPWLTEVLPELNAETANDICLQKEGLCVLYVTTFPPIEEVKNVMQEVSQNYDKQIDRGLQFNFMWLDAKAEADVFGTFKLEEDELPAVVVLNAKGRRKRYMVMKEKAINAVTVGKTLDRIVGGDARFTSIKEGLPSFAKR